jgi:parallel beta-helix repeat protein
MTHLLRKNVSPSYRHDVVREVAARACTARRTRLLAGLCATSTLGTLLFCALQASAVGAIYRIVDSSGKVTYSDRPPSGARAPTSVRPVPVPVPVRSIARPTIAAAAAPTPNPTPTTPAPAVSPTLAEAAAPTPPTSAPPSTAAPAAAPTCTGVQIAPGFTADRIQRLVDGNPNGTVFCFASGTYVLNHYVLLKDANQFICPVRRSCVLTGLDQYRGALAAEYGTTHQLIKGFVVERFITVDGAWPACGLQLRDYGVLEDNEVRFNDNGLATSNNVTVRGNYIHHNKRYGIIGGPGTNIMIQGNEVAFNNTAHFDPNDDAGGSKIAGSEAGVNFLTWRGNHVHDNYGQGIWSDGNVRNAVYEENLVENNTGAGIFHEISWGAVIRNNTLRNNMTAEKGLGKSCWWGANIALNNSQNVAIYGNTIETDGINAICVASSVRHDRAVFPQALANVSVTGNVVKMRGVAHIGVVGETPPENVTFSGNTYYVDNLGGTNWTYLRQMTSEQWKAAGQDQGGTFLSW